MKQENNSIYPTSGDVMKIFTKYFIAFLLLIMLFTFWGIYQGYFVKNHKIIFRLGIPLISMEEIDNKIVKAFIEEYFYNSIYLKNAGLNNNMNITKMIFEQENNKENQDKGKNLDIILYLSDTANIHLLIHDILNYLNNQNYVLKFFETKRTKLMQEKNIHEIGLNELGVYKKILLQSQPDKFAEIYPVYYMYEIKKQLLEIDNQLKELKGLEILFGPIEVKGREINPLFKAISFSLAGVLLCLIIILFIAIRKNQLTNQED
mgnify:CR=1 FL=1